MGGRWSKCCCERWGGLGAEIPVRQHLPSLNESEAELRRQLSLDSAASCQRSPDMMTRDNGQQAQGIVINVRSCSGEEHAFQLTGQEKVADLIPMIATEWVLDISKCSFKLCCNARELKSHELLRDFVGSTLQFSTSIKEQATAQQQAETILRLRRLISHGDLAAAKAMLERAESNGIPETDLVGAKAELQKLAAEGNFGLLSSSFTS